MRIAKIHEMVKDVLTKYPETRSDDSILQTKVISDFYGTDYLYQPYIITLQDKHLPSIESVGRARRKCQELYPELCATADVECARGLKEEEYENYACRHS